MLLPGTLMDKTMTNINVGNTPLVEIKNLDTGRCRLFLKMENHNPSGSLKDRIALAMVEAAEKAEQIKRGDTLIEATSGNTAIALARIAAQRGYRLLIVVTDKISAEKLQTLRDAGAEVIITKSAFTREHPEYYLNLAQKLADEKRGFYLHQFANPANPAVHERTTGPEIWGQMQHQVDAIVCGAGTGGHLTGVGRFIKRVSPTTQMILVDPLGSVLAHYVKTGTLVPKGKWLVEGIGEDQIHATCDLSLVNEAITVDDASSFLAIRELLQRENICAGLSSGTALHAALQYCQRQNSPKRVVTFVYDDGKNYLSKAYNDEWMRAHGFMQ